ncbi:MAG: HAD-IA family hydrolase [Rhodoglobus sp.]
MNGLSRVEAVEILFDLDGTLIDSIAAVELAWKQWATVESVELSATLAYHGRTARDIVASLVPESRVAAAVENLSEFEQHPQVPVLVRPGVTELLAALPAERWAIVTSAARPVALARLAAAGLVAPKLLISGDDVTNGKPHPEPYRAGRRLSTMSGAAVAFEDTVAGLRSARAAGCITVGVLGTEPADQLRKHADAIVNSLADVAVASVGESIVLTLTPTTEHRYNAAIATAFVGSEEGQRSDDV